MRLALAALLALTACPSALGALAAGTRSAGDGWIVQASVEQSDVGPIRVSAGQIRPAPKNEARPWVQHDLVIENESARPLTFAGLRTAAAFLGPSRPPNLLASGEGCGWAYAGKRLEIACLMYLDVLTVEPHGSVTLTVTLWTGLPGMHDLGPGTYVFHKPIRFQAGRELPAEGAGRRRTLEIVYRVVTG